MRGLADDACPGIPLQACDIVTLHVSCVPEQAPLHPVKVDKAAGTAVRVIVWF